MGEESKTDTNDSVRILGRQLARELNAVEVAQVAGGGGTDIQTYNNNTGGPTHLDQADC